MLPSHPIKFFLHTWLRPLSRRTTARWPPSAALCSGASPSAAGSSTSLPAASSAAAMSACPAAAAWCSGSHPSASLTLTASRRAAITCSAISACPCAAARCSAVRRLASAARTREAGQAAGVVCMTAGTGAEATARACKQSFCCRSSNAHAHLVAPSPFTLRQSPVPSASSSSAAQSGWPFSAASCTGICPFWSLTSREGSAGAAARAATPTAGTALAAVAAAAAPLRRRRISPTSRRTHATWPAGEGRRGGCECGFASWLAQGRLSTPHASA